MGEGIVASPPPPQICVVCGWVVVKESRCTVWLLPVEQDDAGAQAIAVWAWRTAPVLPATPHLQLGDCRPQRDICQGTSDCLQFRWVWERNSVGGFSRGPRSVSRLPFPAVHGEWGSSKQQRTLPDPLNNDGFITIQNTQPDEVQPFVKRSVHDCAARNAVACS